MATTLPPVESSHGSALNWSITSTLVDSTAGVLNTTLPALSHNTTVVEVSHRLTMKDETTLVTLIVMGVIVPAVFIIVFLLICRQRRKDMLARRTQMLLQNAQDFALEDYTTEGKATTPTVKTGGFQTI